MTAGVLINPGPGAYDHDKSALKPAFSIGRSPRFLSEKEGTGPAPADYSPTNVLRQAPSFSIGKGDRRLVTFKEKLPGPASYNPNSSFFSPRYTMGSRGQPRPLATHPGPGSYTPRAVVKRAPVTTMGSAPRGAERKSQVPAPNQYTIPAESVTPRYTFTRSRRLEGEAAELPGPGQYDFKNTIAALPDYALSTRD